MLIPKATNFPQEKRVLPSVPGTILMSHCQTCLSKKKYDDESSHFLVYLIDVTVVDRAEVFVRGHSHGGLPWLCRPTSERTEGSSDGRCAAGARMALSWTFKVNFKATP